MLNLKRFLISKALVKILWLHYLAYCMSSLGADFNRAALTRSILVSVLVECPDHSPEKTESFIKRELRTLGDCELVTTNADFELRVLGSTIVNGTKDVVGYCLSYLVVSPSISFKGVLTRLAPAIPPDAFPTIEWAYRDRVLVELHDIAICSPSKLQDACKTIVAAFDTRILEGHRELKRSLRKTLESKEPSTP